MRLFRFAFLFVLCFALAGVQGYYAPRQAALPKQPATAQNPKAAEYDQLYEQGKVAYGKLGYAAAEALFQKCLALAIELKDESRQGDSLNRIGNCYYGLGTYDKALDYYRRSLAIAEKLGNQGAIEGNLENIGLAFNRWSAPICEDISR